MKTPFGIACLAGLFSDFDENAIWNCLLRMSALSTESWCKAPSDLIGTWDDVVISFFLFDVSS